VVHDLGDELEDYVEDMTHTSILEKVVPGEVRPMLASEPHAGLKPQSILRAAHRPRLAAALAMSKLLARWLAGWLTDSLLALSG
jgi:hypothetical protein